MQDVAIAASDLTAPLSAARKRSLVEITLVLRDWNQSRFGNIIPPDHPLLLELYQLAGAFNRAARDGDVVFHAIEAGGAQKQIDLKNGRLLLQPYKNIHAILDKSLAVRTLIRSSYYNGTTTYHVDDLEEQIVLDAKAFGAADGRTVILKDFDAQNFGPNVVNLLIAASRAKQKTGWDIRVEMAQCYTADPKYSAEMYEKTAIDLFNAIKNKEIDLSMIEGISVKDMIGMLNAHSELAQDGNAAKVVQILMRAVYGVDIDINLKYVGVHSHDAGDALPANIAAARQFIQMKRDGAPEAEGVECIVLDGVPAARGFAGVIEMIDGLAEDGVTMSDEQRRIATRMNAIVEQLEGFYKDHLVSEEQWPGAWRSYCFMPGGATPSVEGLAITPIVREWMGIAEREAIHPIIAELLKRGLAKDKAEAENAARYLFAEVNRQLAYDAGLPNSVTPGMLFLTHLSREIIMGMISEAKNDGSLLSRIPDLKTPLSQREPNRERAADDWRHDINHYYKYMRHADSLEYFRGVMPFPQTKVFLDVACAQHLAIALPDPTAKEGLEASYQRSFLNGLVAQEEYKTYRDIILEDPTNAEHVRSVLSMTSADPTTIEKILARHIGIFRLAVDTLVNEREPLTPKLKEDIAARKRAGTLNIPEDEAMAALLVGQRSFEAQAELMLQYPAHLSPERWPLYVERWGRSEGEYALIKAMANAPAYTIEDFAAKHATIFSELTARFADDDAFKKMIAGSKTGDIVTKTWTADGGVKALAVAMQGAGIYDIAKFAERNAARFMEIAREHSGDKALNLMINGSGAHERALRVLLAEEAGRVMSDPHAAGPGSAHERIMRGTDGGYGLRKPASSAEAQPT